MRPVTALTLALTCTCGCGGPASLDVTSSLSQQVANVVVLEWTTATGGRSWVEYGTSEALGQVTPVVEGDGAGWRFALLGLPGASPVWWHAVTETDDGQVEAAGQGMTGGLPSDLPDLEVTVSEPDQSAEPWFLVSAVGDVIYVLIVDRLGRVVWYHTDEAMAEQMLWKARFHPAGGSVLFLATSYTGNGDMGVREVGLEGEDRSHVDIPFAHHAFDMKDDGTVASLVYDVRSWTDPVSGEPIAVAGDAIVEVDSAGESTVRYSTWDSWEPMSRDGWFTAPDYLGKVGDWTHGNALDWYPDRDTYLLSLGFLDSVVEVDPADGSLASAWGLEGQGVCPDGLPLNFQHSPAWLPDGHLLLTTYVEGGRGVAGAEYAPGECLQMTWSYGREEPIRSAASANIQRLANGNTLLNGSTTGTLMEVTPTGEVAWELTSDLGFGFSHVLAVSDLYDP